MQPTRVVVQAAQLRSQRLPELVGCARAGCRNKNHNKAHLGFLGLLGFRV